MSITEQQLQKTIDLAKMYGATRLLLFGSTLTKPNQAHDLDLACDGISDWKLFELGARLEEDLGIKLDIIPLNPPTPFTKHIEQNARVLF